MAAHATLRTASPADAKAMARVHVDSWLVGYRGLLADELLAGLSLRERELMWHRRLSGEDEQHRGRTVDVAVAGEAIVGFVVSGASGERDAPARCGEVYALYVHPDHWSMGVGQALMSSAVEHLLAIAAADALLWVLASNTRARRFYEHAGWAWDGHSRRKHLTVRDFASVVEEVRYGRRLLGV